VAYSLVSAGAVSTSTTNGTASITPAFGQSTGSGNLLIGWAFFMNAGAGGSGSSFSTSSSGWSLALTNEEFISGTAAVEAAIFYKPNSSSGESAPTFTITGGVTLTSMLIGGALAEFSGGATSAPLDQTGHAQGAATSPFTAVAAAADKALGELLVSCGAWQLSKAGSVTTADTYNNGATPTTNNNNDATSTASHYRLAWGTTTGNSAADQDSQSNNSMNLAAGNVVIASFLLPTARVFNAEQPSLRTDPFSLQAIQQAVSRGAFYMRKSGISVPRLWLPTPA
jgi:hypothetical protein